MNFLDLDLNEYKENNSIEVCGVIASEVEFCYQAMEEKFNSFVISIARKSGVNDELSVVFSERLLDSFLLKTGLNVRVVGQFRSHNNLTGVGNKLKLNIFAKDIETIHEDETIYANAIRLVGHLCKAPVYRKTPFGREICDVLLAVNRKYGKTDYIPCIIWGRNARYAGLFSVGACVEIHGRAQSREYTKVTEFGEEKKVVYEISVERLQKLEGDSNDSRENNDEYIDDVSADD